MSEMRDKITEVLTGDTMKEALSRHKAGEDVDPLSLVHDALHADPQHLALTVKCVTPECSQTGVPKTVTTVSTDGFFQIPNLVCARCLKEMEVVTYERLS